VNLPTELLIYNSSNENLTNVVLGNFDFRPGSTDNCNNTLTNVTFSNGKPIIYHGGETGVNVNGTAGLIIFCGTSSSVISNASVSANRTEAILILGGTNNTVSDTDAYSRNNYAISAVLANNTRIVNNTLSVGWNNCGSDCASAFYAGDGSNNVFLQNTIYADSWIDSNEPDIALNDSTSGNSYNLFNGTPASALCDIRSSTYTWADGGSDLPLSNNSNCLMGWGFNYWGNSGADGIEDWHPWVGGAPPVAVGGGSSSVQTRLSYTFNCSNGNLSISTLPAAPGARLRIDRTGTFSPMFSNADSQGTAHFAITQSGRYFAELSGSYSGSIGMDLQLCSAAPQPILAPNGTEQTPTSAPTVSPTENQSAPSPPAPPQGKGAAQDSISSAQSAIDVALQQGKDVSLAAQTLEQASRAFAAGNYAEAERLSLLAMSQIRASAPTQAAHKAAQQQTSQENTGELAAGSTILFAGAIVLIAAAIGAYLVFRRRKSRQ